MRFCSLVELCEGIQQVGKNRNATINCVHFTSDMSVTDELWRKVYAYAHKTYDLEKVTKICVHGDGGQWFQKGFDEFVDATYFLDGFHLQKRFRPFLPPFTSECIKTLLKTSGCDGFKIVANSIIGSCNAPIRKKTRTKNLNYIINDWDVIVNRCKEGAAGTCNEAMISHVLSERLSRNPIGCIKDGLNAMATLRVYAKNGWKVAPQHFRRSAPEKQVSKLKNYAEHAIKSFLYVKIDNTIFEHQHFSMAKVTPISTIIKSLGAIKCSPDYSKS